MKILWLTGWYPNTINYLEGDFVQRHAKAVSLIHKVEVIHIKKDDKKYYTSNIREDIKHENNLTERIIYYYPKSIGVDIIDKLLSHRMYIRLYKKALKSYINENGLPHLVHVYIALKAGLLGLWLKKKYNLPYLISEQWTAYLPEAKPNLEDYSSIKQKWVKKIFSKTTTTTVVSKVLGDAILNRFNIRAFHVIPNVVDTNIFFPVPKLSSSVTKFIHVSLLNYQKNVENIIEAFYIIKNREYNFQLTIFGPDDIKLKQLIKDRGLSEHIIFKEEVPQILLAEDIQHSDALILYSRYETFGCVVIEANACGIPAILSDITVFREYIIENTTGIFAQPNHPENLAETLIKFCKNKNTFSQKEIADYTSNKFSYETIAKQFDKVYRTIV